MDEPGWHADRRAQASYRHYEKNPDGSYRPLVSVNPINEPFVRNFDPRPAHSRGTGSWGPPAGPPPGLPGFQQPQGNYNTTEYRPLPWMPPGHSNRGLLHATPSSADRPRMNPHLQFLCGPLLRYDTVENGVWYGAVMVVTADAGSVYEPQPRVDLEWGPVNHPSQYMGSSAPSRHGSPPPPQERWRSSTRVGSATAHGRKLCVYNGPNGPSTFWRMMIQIPLTQNEMGVTYRVNGGYGLQFFVPGRDQNMRWAAYSCNGFSAGVNADEFKGPGHASGFDPVWTDLLKKHAERPFHVLVGGGDQLYCDSLLNEPEFEEFLNLKTGEEKIAYQVSEAVIRAVDRFYFSHYCLVFRNGKFAEANSSIPMANMLDDHDLIDGFGSYPEELQLSPLFQLIGSRAYHFYLLFQCFTVDSVDGVNFHPGRHTFRSTIIGGAGAWIPYPAHHTLTYLGPCTRMIMMDCRAERMVERVCSETSYRRVFDRLWELPRTVKHLVVQVGIPIAYPRMNFLERALDSPLNPIIALGKKDKLGLGSLVNKFNKDAELLDDLMDHWTSKEHKQERSWFVQQLQGYASMRQIRVTFLSGDVHCAAVGLFKTLATRKPIDPVADHRYMINVVTSAIVNTPPPAAVIAVVSPLSEKTHRSMHSVQTDETMIPLFQTDTDGNPCKSKNIMGRRNYAIVDYIPETQELRFEIRVEKEKGVGDTVGYVVMAPRPGWVPPR